MAKVVKSRARSPLAEGTPSYSWAAGFSGLPADAGYRLRLAGALHSFSFEMSLKEWLNFIDFFASRETWQGYSLDKRSRAEKLRALADKLEKEA